MIDIEQYIQHFYSLFPQSKNRPIWELIDDLENIVTATISSLSTDYTMADNIAIHKTAIVERGAILKGTIIISKHCFIAANAYLRGTGLFGYVCKNWSGFRNKTIDNFR